MNQPIPIIFAVAGVVLVIFVFMAVWASRYAKVPPNKVMIVSGRKIQLPDGRVLGYRIVKGGGTFVIPVIERVDLLSLEIVTLDLSQFRARAANGQLMQIESAAQVKIDGDDASLAAASENFLNKNATEMKAIVQPVLEQDVANALAACNAETVTQNPTVLAGKVQESAKSHLAKMGLSLVSFSVRDARPV